ncbi:MAG: O-antigen ligase family protein [Actinobacteria bacterium]|nr:O-antigen ligase family protein [Actinomycetota bacterium]
MFIVLLVPITAGAGIFPETKIFIYVFLGTVFLIWLFEQLKKDCFELIRTNLDKYLILFLLVSLLSFYKLLNIHASIDGIFSFIIYFLFFWLTANNFESRDKISFALNGLIATGSLVALYGLWQYLYGLEDLANWAPLHNISFSIENRIFSTFINPNHLSGFLSLIIPLAFVSLMRSKSKIKTILIGSGILLMGTSLILTYSRGGWISSVAALSIVFFGIIYKYPRKTITATIVLVLMLLAVNFFITKNPSTNQSNKVGAYSALDPNTSATSLQGRVQLWRGTVNMIKENYLLGTGIGTYSYIYPIYQYEGKYSKHAHNTFLEIFAETGIAGFLSFLLIVFLVLKNQFNLARLEKDEEYKLYALAFFAAGVSFVIRNLIDFDWYSPGETLIFWFFAGLTISIAKLSDKKIYSLRGGKTIASLASIGIIMLILSSLSIYLGNSFFETGKNLIDEGDYSEATVNFKKAISFDPLQALYHSKLSEVYFRKKSISNAIYEAKKAIKLEPYWSFYHYQLSIYYGALGKIKLQEEELKKAVSFYNNNPSYHNSLAEFYYSNKKYKLAIAEYKKTIALSKYYKTDPNAKITENLPVYIKEPLLAIKKAYIGLGNTYVALNSTEKALKEYDKALNLDDSDWIIHFNKGFTYQKLEFWDKAISNYEKTLKLKPDQSKFKLIRNKGNRYIRKHELG